MYHMVPRSKKCQHYSDIIMSAMAQITCVSIVCSTVCSSADRGNIKAPRHWPLWGESTGDRHVNSPHNGPVTRKMFPFDDVIMNEPIIAGTTIPVYYLITHWGRVTHICVNKLTIIGSDNDLSPGRRQAITWTNAGILLIVPWGTNFSDISIVIHIFSFKKMHLKMSSGNWQPFCLGLKVLSQVSACHYRAHVDFVFGCSIFKCRDLTTCHGTRVAVRAMAAGRLCRSLRQSWHQLSAW